MACFPWKLHHALCMDTFGLDLTELWCDLLGAGSAPSANCTTNNAFLPFKTALLCARSWKLTCTTEWKAWAKSSARPANIPFHPDRAYMHEGWQGYGHWLGTGNVGVAKDTKFLPFKKALLYARSLKVFTQKEWELWSKSSARPANIPSRPDQSYKYDGWQGYGHWLGTGNRVGGKLDFLPFKEALLYARSLKMVTAKQWAAWCKSSARPANMPSAPHRTYKHVGWQGYGHWLGTGNIQSGKQEILPFAEALLHARSLKLKGRKEWEAWSKSAVRPADMPSHPDRVYKHDGWQRWGHWLGSNTLRTKD